MLSVLAPGGSQLQMEKEICLVSGSGNNLLPASDCGGNSKSWIICRRAETRRQTQTEAQTSG